MKGIILAGGYGTRLYPLTKVVSKQLLPVYDKPTIYYPLSMLMLAGIKEILIISTPKDTPRIEELLGDGSQLGIHLEYKIQENPKGIADAYIVGEDFIDSEPTCMILGDNVFYGNGLSKLLQDSAKLEKGGIVFGYYVDDPHRYGIVEFDKDGNAISVEEKPKEPKSNYALPGLYFFDGDVSNVAKQIKPSARGELEIPSVMDVYLKRGELSVKILSRGIAWLDTGTHKSLNDASDFVRMIEERQGLKIGCIEEISYRMGYIDKKQLLKLADGLQNTGYDEYLKKVLKV